MCILLDRKTPNPKFQIVFLKKIHKNDLFSGLLGVYLPLNKDGNKFVLIIRLN